MRRRGGCVGLCDCARATGGDGGDRIEWGVTNEVNGTEMNTNEMVSCGGAGRAALPSALPSAMPSPVSCLASSEPNMANAWRFQFWTNEYDSAWAFSWGKLRFVLGDAIERGLDGLPPGANEAAYCWIEIRPRWNSWIEFYGDELPTGAQIPPGTTRVFETEYTPLEPSGEENDVVATATYVEDFLNETHSATAAVTSIRLRLEAVYDAPENHNPSRHVYGVGELVAFHVQPILPNVVLSTKRYDTTDDSGFGYELFGGFERCPIVFANEYRCPISSSYKPPIGVCYEGCEYHPSIAIVEPSEIVTSGAAWGENPVDPQYYEGSRKCWPFGAVGPATLVTTNYVGPMHVSFEGVAMSEVPCYEEDVVTGCFATNHLRTHNIEAGAGELHMIQNGNFFFVDGASSNAPEPNWQPDSRLDWKIPIGWHRIRSNYFDGRQLSGPDYEHCDDVGSRKLLVGDRTDKYMQKRHIDESGTYRTDKFDHWISRSRWCRVILDGMTLQWTHLW